MGAVTALAVDRAVGVEGRVDVDQTLIGAEIQPLPRDPAPEFRMTDKETAVDDPDDDALAGQALLVGREGVDHRNAPVPVILGVLGRGNRGVRAAGKARGTQRCRGDEKPEGQKSLHRRVRC